MALFCTIALVLSAVSITMNWLGLLSAVRHKRGYSFIPQSMFSLMGALAAWLHPNAAVSAWFWVPLLIDPGLGAFLVIWAVQRAVQAVRKSRYGGHQQR